MDKWIIVKIAGDAAALLVAISSGICIIFPDVPTWIQIKAGKVKDWSKCLRVFIGLTVIAVSGFWFYACVETEFKKASENSPAYSRAFNARLEAQQLARDLRDMALFYKEKQMDNPNFSWLHYKGLEDKELRELSELDVSIVKINWLSSQVDFSKIQPHREFMFEEIADEYDRLASQLQK